jgi:predicted ATPase
VERTARALVAAAAPAGLLVMLDDLQWADDATVELLRHVCAELPGSRLLVAVATRDMSRLGSASALPIALTVALPPLTMRDIDGYVRSVAGRPVAGSWAAYLSRMTGGNPLLLRELVRALVAEDRFAGSAASMPTPVSVRSVAGARLDLVGDGCRWLLGGCSVLGDEFDLPLLAAVADRDADQIAGWLAEAVGAGVLVEGPDVPAGPV